MDTVAWGREAEAGERSLHAGWRGLEQHRDRRLASRGRGWGMESRVLHDLTGLPRHVSLVHGWVRAREGPQPWPETGCT